MPELVSLREEEEGDGGGGTFLTAAGSMPNLRRGGRRPRRLPKMAGGAMNALELGHQNALNEVAAGQAELDAQIGALHQRMAKLEGMKERRGSTPKNVPPVPSQGPHGATNLHRDFFGGQAAGQTEWTRPYFGS